VSTDTVLVAGTVSDPWRQLCSADVVVAAAGDAAIADVAAARAPLVAVPQERPFREQVEHVRLLADQGLCVAAAPWPGRRDWPELLASAMAIGGDRWAEVSDGLGGQRAAGLLQELAGPPGSSRVA
jgi:UDP-N-acetylglucosamine:LPS N-acetylglucosamine transferase